MTDDLVRWLGACLDEDERIARATDQTLGQRNLRWSVKPVDDAFHKVVAAGYYDVGTGEFTPQDAAFIAEHDPARVLREIDAKRRVLARHCAAPVPPGNEWAEEYPYCVAHAYEGPDGIVVYPVELRNCPELRDMATAYVGRPGYQESWRP